MRRRLLLTFVHNAGTGDDNVLNQVDLTTISQDECRALDRYYANTLTNNMLCAGHMPGGQGTCFGDSGGPLVCNCGDRWWVHGVFSVVVWPLSILASVLIRTGRLSSPTLSASYRGSRQKPEVSVITLISAMGEGKGGKGTRPSEIPMLKKN